MVGQVATAAELIEMSRRHHPDLVIIAIREGAPPPFGWELFAADPRPRVLGIASEGREGFVYELRPYRMPIGELSPETLVNAVRRVSDVRATVFEGLPE